MLITSWWCRWKLTIFVHRIMYSLKRWNELFLLCWRTSVFCLCSCYVESCICYLLVLVIGDFGILIGCLAVQSFGPVLWSCISPFIDFSNRRYMSSYITQGAIFANHDWNDVQAIVEKVPFWVLSMMVL